MNAKVSYQAEPKYLTEEEKGFGSAGMHFPPLLLNKFTDRETKLGMVEILAIRIG